MKLNKIWSIYICSALTLGCLMEIALINRPKDLSRQEDAEVEVKISVDTPKALRNAHNHLLSWCEQRYSSLSEYDLEFYACESVLLTEMIHLADRGALELERSRRWPLLLMREEEAVELVHVLAFAGEVWTLSVDSKRFPGFCAAFSEELRHGY